jgi:ssDNA-binding Zn-finger/Zn-ribbon topoisomerase 1
VWSSLGRLAKVEEESGEFEGDYITPFYSELSQEGTLVRCPKCGAAEMIFPNLRTCSECGMEIVRRSSNFEVNEPTKETIVPPIAAQGEAPEVGKCIVCGMSIHRGEPALYCPNCAGKAHRAHLLEYVHVKGKCPICHASIGEGELGETVRRKRVATRPEKLCKRAR